MSNLGGYIRQKREEKNMSIEELSEKTKISIAVLNDIENGKFDRYKGDEAYVKMYLKKITGVLDLDTQSVTDQYIELTREIELEDIKEKDQQVLHNEEVVKKGKKFSFESPQFARKPSVYEDKSHVKIIQTIIILVLVCLVVVVIWYGFYSTRSKSENPSFIEPDTPTVEGDVNTNDTNEQNQNQTQDNNQTSQIVTLTREESSSSNDINFTMALPEGATSFKLKMEFTTPVWAQLRVNGEDYQDFEGRVYPDEAHPDGEVVELEISLENFEDMRLRLGNYSEGQHYYINDQEIALTEEDYTQNPINLNVSMVKE